jgi:hypothetical protein
MTKKKPSVPGPDAVAAETPRSRADRLFRAASECVRQRERYARLVEAGVNEEEQQSVLRMACLCDTILLQAIAAYEQGATSTNGTREEWHTRANALWHAARDYQRRHDDCDKRTRQLSSHSASKLAELTTQFDLEASALLALRLAVASYQAAVPDAELRQRPQTFVA